MTTTTNHEPALHAEIDANPSDMLPRLVYADFLDDNRRPSEAVAWRWLVSKGKSPTPYLGIPGYHWFEQPNRSRERQHDLHHDIFQYLKGDKTIVPYAVYPSPLHALLDAARAAAKVL